MSDTSEPTTTSSTSSELPSKEEDQPTESTDSEVQDASSQTIPPSRLSRLATGAINAVTTAGVATDPLQQTSIKSRLRKFMVPIGVLLFLLLLFTLFREILLPFILALVIVYLMEPVVSRIGKTEDDPKGLPRWVAVILVYIIFFGVVTTSVVLIIPRFVSEIVRFGETVPEEVTRFRTEQLPELNGKFQAVIKDYVPPLGPQAQDESDESRDMTEEIALAMGSARDGLHAARTTSARRARAQARAAFVVDLSTRSEITWGMGGDPGFEGRVYRADYPPRIKAALRAAEPSMTGGTWRYVGDYQEPSFRMVPVKGGGFDFYLNDVELDVEPLEGSDGWRVRKTAAMAARGTLPLLKSEGKHNDETHGETLHSMLDLEQGLNELVEEAVTSSTARIASVITYAQELVVGIIQAFVALILTLMVAAFITIDLHAVMNFFRNLIPSEHRLSYDELLVDMDRGLSGVVRGQLMICLINGVLTYIGLVILDIKFSLLLAVVAGVLSLIPIFGTILSTVPIVLFALTSGLMTGVFALLWILGIHFVEANILNPKIIGTSAHIHPVIVIFALLAGESAFGLVGALLAVPTASLLLTLFRFFVMRSPAGQQAIKQMDEEVVINAERPTSS